MSDKKHGAEVPDHVIESFARCILPAIRKYFDSEEGQREYTQWKAKKERGDAKKSHGK